MNKYQFYHCVQSFHKTLETQKEGGNESYQRARCEIRRAQNQNTEPKPPEPRKTVTLGARCGARRRCTLEEILPRGNGRRWRNERGLCNARAEEYLACDAWSIGGNVGVFSAEHGELVVRVDRDRAGRV